MIPTPAVFARRLAKPWCGLQNENKKNKNDITSARISKGLKCMSFVLCPLSPFSLLKLIIETNCIICKNESNFNLFKLVFMSAINTSPSITLPLVVPPELKKHVKLAFLLPAKNILSHRFSGEHANVIDCKRGSLNVGKIEKENRSRCYKVGCGVLKVLAWLTVIIPLIAFIAVKIFHCYNKVDNKKPEVGGAESLKAKIKNRKPRGKKKVTSSPEA